MASLGERPKILRVSALTRVSFDCPSRQAKNEPTAIGLSIGQFADFDALEVNEIANSLFELYRQGKITTETIGYDSTAADIGFTSDLFPNVFNVEEALLYLQGVAGEGASLAYVNLIAFLTQLDRDYASNYRETEYDVDGNLSVVTTWDSSAKTHIVFTKSFTYNGDGYLATITLNHPDSGQTLLRTLTYNPDSTLKTVTRTYS